MWPDYGSLNIHSSFCAFPYSIYTVYLCNLSAILVPLQPLQESHCHYSVAACIRVGVRHHVQLKLQALQLLCTTRNDTHRRAQAAHPTAITDSDEVTHQEPSLSRRRPFSCSTRPPSCQDGPSTPSGRGVRTAASGVSGHGVAG